MKIIITSLLAATLLSVGDSHKEMLVKDEAGLERYCLNFFSPMGNSSFSGSSGEELIHFSGNYDDERFEINCTKSTHKKHVDVNFQANEKSSGLLDIFGSSTDAKNNWNVYLKKKKPMELNLSFGYGQSVLDLSELPITNLKIESVEANVKLNYSDGESNPVKMDSLIIDAEFGEIVFDAPELSRAKYLAFDNAYGTTILNIKQQPKNRFSANVYVGSGNFYVNLASADIPVKVVVKERHLATLKVPEGFVKTEGGMYENAAYKRSNINPLVFNLYGSVGEVVFQIQP